MSWTCTWNSDENTIWLAPWTISLLAISPTHGVRLQSDPTSGVWRRPPLKLNWTLGTSRFRHRSR